MKIVKLPQLVSYRCLCFFNINNYVCHSDTKRPTLTRSLSVEPSEIKSKLKLLRLHKYVSFEISPLIVAVSVDWQEIRVHDLSKLTEIFFTS